MDFVKRNKKSDKKKATTDLYGKFSTRHIRMTTEKLEKSKNNKNKKMI